MALEVDGLAGEDFRGVSFSVRRGEVVGISGATSSGRVGVAEAVAGLGRHTAGAIRIDGRPLPSGDVPAALALGRRLRAEEPARPGPGAVAVGRRQHHHDHQPTGSARSASSRRGRKTRR